jgi:hypothetical protein
MSRARIRIGPLWPYAVLIGIPAAGFILPDLLGGQLLMTGDNLQQNYPLHVLVGTMLRHGQLPFWNQYIFSGTPLLAGFNAGAFYPLVGLFVILPDRAAWIATEVILFSLVAVGMYLFLRALTLSTVACVLAAVTFAFSGVVLNQVNHVDMTEGFASIPFMLLAVLHIVRDGRWRWSILLGLAFALVIFGGAPEAMLDEALLVLAYAAISAGFDRLRWWRVLTRCGVGAALALALAAVQWLPGIAAISNSQRSGLGDTFAATGGFPNPYGLLSVVPYLFGGYGAMGERSFFGQYNLPEVGIYLGILPIVALVSLWHPRWPSRLARRERLTWYAVGLIGLLLALGADTPLEHVFNAIPLYGHQRLQSRNMIDVSVAVCVLFAGWLDRRTDSGGACVRFDRWVGFIPFGVVLAVGGWAIFDPGSLISLAMVSSTPSEVHTVREATIFALGFSAGAGVIVWLRSVLPYRYWMSAAAVFTLIDLGLAAGTSQLIYAPSNDVVAGDTTVESYIAAHLPAGGRFDVYDPEGYANGLNNFTTGLPDDNVLARLPSVGGYASIVSGSYNSITLTHQSGDFNVPQLQNGQFTELDLQDIVTAPEYFLLALQTTPTTLAGVRQESEVHGQDPILPMGIAANVQGNGYNFYPAPRATLVAGETSAWFFGRTLAPARASVLLASPAAGGQIRFGKVGDTGATRWGPAVAVAPGAQEVNGALPPGNATGLAVQVVSGRLPPHQVVVLIGGRAYELDGPLSGSVRPGAWRQQGSIDDYTLFVRTQPPTPLHAAAGTGGPAPRIEVLSSTANAESIRVRTSTRMVLVRDVGWDRGWHASISEDGGPSSAVAVTQHGLVQQVRLPAGTDVVTFKYSPPHWLVASALTEGSALLLIILLVDTVLRRRGNRGITGRRGRGGRVRGAGSEGAEPEPAAAFGLDAHKGPD